MLREQVLRVDRARRTLVLGSGRRIAYKHNVCIASGARPRLIARHPRVVGIRDVDSAARLAERLRLCGRVAIVGNGAIALEAVAAVLSGLPSLQVLWVSRENYMGSSFLDATASAFLEQSWPGFHRASAGKNGGGVAAFLPEEWWVVLRPRTEWGGYCTVVFKSFG